MELNKCTRCGAFYATDDNVCPKCVSIDNLEFSTFKNYIEENGYENSIDTIASQTGISQKNISRFIGYENLNISNEIIDKKKNGGNIGITLN